MPIYDIGIVLDGVKIIERTYHEKEFYKFNKNISFILDIIMSSSSVLLNDSLKFMILDEFTIAMYSNTIEIIKLINNKDQIIPIKIGIFCIGDRSLIQYGIFIILKKIYKEFVKIYFKPQNPYLNYLNLQKYDNFKYTIDKYLEDLKFSPIERLKLGVL